jgi:hypothetical protein
MGLTAGCDEFSRRRRHADNFAIDRPVDTALGLFLSRPASRAGIIAVPRFGGAWHASDGCISRSSQRVIGQLIHPHVIDDILACVMRQRIDLQTPVDHLHHRQAGTCASVEPLAACNPGIEALQGGMKWKRFADLTAAVRIRSVEHPLCIRARDVGS